MSKLDRDKWNQRYTEESYQKNNPVTLLAHWLPQIPVGRALDVACGAGRNSILLAQNHFEVDAIDISRAGLERAKQVAEQQGLEVNWIEHDLDETYPFVDHYSLVVVMWYVDLALIGKLCKCLAPGGYLVCEEHLMTEQDVIGPTSDHFRVAPGALRAAVTGLEILLYEESIEPIPEGGQVASAKVVARNS